MKISKLSEYMAYVEELPSEFSLSRGQSQDYALLPSALRTDSSGNRKFSKRVIRNFLEQFKINSYQYMTKEQRFMTAFIYWEHQVPTNAVGD